MPDRIQILIVDDDLDTRNYYRSILESKGYAVTEAESGQEGREKLAAAHWDLVVLDVMMEEIDSGFQVARWIRDNGIKTRLILLSSIADASTQVFDLSELPLHEIINKPARPDALLKTVEKLLRVIPA